MSTQEKTNNTSAGGWFSGWFSSVTNKEEDSEPINPNPEETNYSRNQATLSSLRSQKKAANAVAGSSSKANRDSAATLVRNDTESYLDAPKTNNNDVLRRKVTRRLQLTNNNLVIDCPIPDRLLGALTFSDQDEYSHMRYTAATCEPDEFEAKGFTLRPKIFNRKTELFIVMTMYNVSTEGPSSYRTNINITD